MTNEDQRPRSPVVSYPAGVRAADCFNERRGTVSFRHGATTLEPGKVTESRAQRGGYSNRLVIVMGRGPEAAAVARKRGGAWG